MPPFVARKRERSPSPVPSAKRSKPTPRRSKPTIFETADETSHRKKHAEANRKLLQSLNDDDDDESSLSEIDSDGFEDVALLRTQREGKDEDDDEEEDHDDDDDDDGGMDWEDAIQQGSVDHGRSGAPSTAPSIDDIGDISVAVNGEATYTVPTVSAGIDKKGPSKRERQARIRAHCMHVQSLMWHNTVRNYWLNDTKLQQILVDGLPEGVKKEVLRWKASMGRLSAEEIETRKRQTAAKNRRSQSSKATRKSGGRDWEYEAQNLEQGVPDLSRGDPLLTLLKVLAAYWRKRFTITAPGLRKQGYQDMRHIGAELRAWKRDKSNADRHGERIDNIRQFREMAKSCEGSRDVGAQLFTALLRGIGLDTRMVANLQPVGFGWSKSEEADMKRQKKKASGSTNEDEQSASDIESGPSTPHKTSEKKKRKEPRKSARGDEADPVNLDDSDLSSSVASSDLDDRMDDDGISVVKSRSSASRKSPLRKYDRDLAFPIYWCEVCSPATNRYIPVDPIVLSTIASNEQLLQSFEPRGKKADVTKQVICYTIGFAADATAKDVTVRYLKKHQLPGKTKGMRMPIEKLPVYNRKGKVKKYEDYDWFRTVMSPYDRPQRDRTTADDLEDQTDLKPFKAQKDGKEVQKQSLQWYKQSAEFVLEQHLRREEALLPGAEVVETFTAGKGDKAVEHSVFLRSDVVTCKTVESWHKEGRALKEGQHPMKLVPMRAVTLVKKREMEDAQRETGERLKQGLYSRDQTEWIIPPPIKNGIIPKNAFGNMDVYVPTMVPKGAVHLPLKGSAKICRKLEIDYAEACTGFEFGNQRAVPVLTGVVVAKENEKMVREAWRVAQEEAKRKEDTKRTALSLQWWRKMMLGLRVIDRMRREYGNSSTREEDINPFAAKANHRARATDTVEKPDVHVHDEALGGGFLLDDEDVDGKADPIQGLVEEHAMDDHEKLSSIDRDLEPAFADGELMIENDPEDQKPMIVDDDNDADETMEMAEIDTEPVAPSSSRATTRRGEKPAKVRTRKNERTPRRKPSSTKVTPRKSQYFTAKDNDDDVEDDEQEAVPSPDESDDDPNNSEQEVVRPRRTTARTRGKS